MTSSQLAGKEPTFNSGSGPVWVMGKKRHGEIMRVLGAECGFAAAMSSGFAMFAIMLSLTISYYQIDVWALTAIMIGVSFACVLARVGLFASCPSIYKPREVIRPVLVLMVLPVMGGGALGIAAGYWYNYHPGNALCEKVEGAGSDPLGEEYVELGPPGERLAGGCADFRDGARPFLNAVLIPVSMLLAFPSLASRGTLVLPEGGGQESA